MSFEAVDIKDKDGFQSIRIPEELKISDDKVYLRKLGNVLFVIPYHNPWSSFVDSLSLFTPDFMDNRDQSDNQIRSSLD